MLARFNQPIDYGQLLAHAESQLRPGLLWTDDHVAQGFAWADDTVAFGIPDHDGECCLEVVRSPYTGPTPDALWAIRVPFAVDGLVMVGSVFAARQIEIAPGDYDLVFEAGPGDSSCAYRLSLTFAPPTRDRFQIIRKGGELTADRVVAHRAERAG